MFYFKKIVFYFDYYEYGEKKKSCGYGKILVKEQEVTIELHIKGLNIRESRMCDIYTVGETKSQLGRLLLDKGTGYYNACFHGGDMDGNGLRIFDMTGLYISVDEDKYCKTTWKWGKLPTEYPKEEYLKEEYPKTEYQETEIRQEPPETEASAGQQPVEREAPPENAQGASETGNAAGAPEVEAALDAAVSDRRPAAEKETGSEEAEPDAAAAEAQGMPETENAAMEEQGAPGAEGAVAETPLHKSQLPDQIFMRTDRAPLEESMLQERLHEDKWQQLCSLYPVCHPFADNEEYISIAPKDFVILRKEYQNLVSNSFLLHSFYNYHHVILGKVGNKGDDYYYIGVPGAYLEREKRVAVMFGFEGFAQSERGNRNRGGRAADSRGMSMVEEGAFGYYMRKVEI